MCYSCGLGLKNWLKDDVPIVSHSQFGKECQIVQNNLRLIQSMQQTPPSTLDEKIVEVEPREFIQRNIECMFCCKENIQVVFLPCKHSMCCKKCCEKLNLKCPICRQTIEFFLNIYLN